LILAKNARKEFLIGQSSRSHATYRRPSLDGFSFLSRSAYFISVSNDIGNESATLAAEMVQESFADTTDCTKETLIHGRLEANRSVTNRD